ncbi:16S rRNA (guanine(527)-N(7))-methyltransferase RsmG [Actinomyces minihominis]|uniref:16S rRNA (guanine(527)-N(7))-methyltransferase RsmG n=1 Tax=Actinomyces minihominis TaxID=2002838 RepID=UPI000C0874C2|nr:16S rRNA (guanine(527)-N(7))-methyltransferase RsmG [Actinomyces minihominis]
MESPNDLTLSLFGTGASAVEAFANLLAEEGEKRGLIGPKEAERIWSRHIVNSAALLPFLPSRGSLIDVGSGAGLPGLVVAAARPDLDVILVEPMERRCEWLFEASETIGLDNVQIVRDRAENIGRKLRADVVTARAVAALPKLLRLTSKMVAPGGRLLALKGRRAGEEIIEAKDELKRRHLTAELHEVVSVMDGEITYVVECRRTV